MRIIGGIYRGRSIVVPKHSALRPTSDRVRETVFNVLTHGKWKPKTFCFWNCRVLDSFCGTGALGIEALSRGARHIAFMDIDKLALDTCRNNIKRIGETDQCKFFQNDCLFPPVADLAYNLVFMDAPYNRKLTRDALHALANNGWFMPNATIAVETSITEDLRLDCNFNVLDERKFRSTKVIFYRFLPII